MATSIIPGQTTWSMTRDAEGHREYKIRHIVLAAFTDGPATVMQTAGLPVPHSTWSFDGDVDQWATCQWDAIVTPILESEPNRHWSVEQKFTTKPPDNKSCKDAQSGDPLLEPMKVSGSFTKYTEEATQDRFGRPVHNSAHEQMRGAQVEFDKNRPSIKVEQNLASLGLETFAPMIDTVNDSPLWGLPRRCIKLSTVSWERKFYGQCSVYYTRTLEFEVRYDTFDRDVLDEGTKVLNGHWGDPDNNPDDLDDNWQLDKVYDDSAGAFARPDPDPNNPAHFIRAKDRQGENCKLILNGHGLPVTDPVGDVPTDLMRPNGNVSYVFPTSPANAPGVGALNDLKTKAADGTVILVGTDLVRFSLDPRERSSPFFIRKFLLGGQGGIPENATITGVTIKVRALAFGRPTSISVQVSLGLLDDFFQTVDLTNIGETRSAFMAVPPQEAGGGWAPALTTNVMPYTDICGSGYDLMGLPGLSRATAVSDDFGILLTLINNDNPGADPVDCYIDQVLLQIMYRENRASDQVGKIHVEKYGESNLLLLGIPTSF